MGSCGVVVSGGRLHHHCDGHDVSLAALSVARDSVARLVGAGREVQNMWCMWGACGACQVLIRCSCMVWGAVCHQWLGYSSSLCSRVGGGS